MITVGFDFGTHQTKICYETIEEGTVFYEVFKFKKPNGEETLTLPSFIRRLDDGRLLYGHDAVDDSAGGQAITYFKQEMFSWTVSDEVRIAAEKWSVLYLAFIYFHLARKFPNGNYIVQMGMPTDANPEHYAFCKKQAMKVMGAAMALAGNVYEWDLEEFLAAPYSQLADLAVKCMEAIPSDIHEAREWCPIFIFPEAYAALIPLIKDSKLPEQGPNLFVDIGGGTVDISLFTSRLTETESAMPYLHYFDSIPYGLNMIMGEDFTKSHSVEVRQGQLTKQCINRFRTKLKQALRKMMKVLWQRYTDAERTSVMPFVNLCGQIFDYRPICYSGGGSMVSGLKLPMESDDAGKRCNFSQVTTVSQLIDHSKLYVDDGIFHVLATAFALSHSSLLNRDVNLEPDSIQLVPDHELFGGIRVPPTYGWSYTW